MPAVSYLLGFWELRVLGSFRVIASAISADDFHSGMGLLATFRRFQLPYQATDQLGFAVSRSMRMVP